MQVTNVITCLQSPSLPSVLSSLSKWAVPVDPFLLMPPSNSEKIYDDALMQYDGVELLCVVPFSTVLLPTWGTVYFL